MINLIRCDDRLIHGQCMTILVQHFKIKHIIVIDEFTATNSIMKMVIEKAAMPGMVNEAHTLASAIEPIKKAINDNVGTMIVFRFPTIAKDLFDTIDDLPKTLMVGPVQKRPDAMTICDGTYVNSSEIEVFKYLDNKGIEIYFQAVPDNKRIDWSDIKGKY